MRRLPTILITTLLTGTLPAAAQPGQQEWLALADQHAHALGTDAGQRFFERFSQHHAQIVDAIQDKCGRSGSKSGRSNFQSVLILDHDGRVTDVLNMPDSPHFRCFGKQMRDQTYPTPPTGSYPVVVTFQLPTSN